MSRFKIGDIVVDKNPGLDSARIEVTESSPLTFKGTVIRSGYAGDNPEHPGAYKQGDWSYWFQSDFILWAEIQEPVVVNIDPIHEFEVGDIVIHKDGDADSGIIKITRLGAIGFDGEIISSGYIPHATNRQSKWHIGESNYWLKQNFVIKEKVISNQGQKFKVGDLVYPHKNKYHTIAIVTSSDGNTFMGTILYTEHPHGFAGDILNNSLSESYTLANVEMLFKLKGNG